MTITAAKQSGRGIVDQTELAPGTTAREAAFGRRDKNDALVREMKSNSPDGIAATKLQGRRPQTRSGYRLLDDRILEFGLQFLDQELSKPLLSGLAKYRALVAAAQETLDDPRKAEVLVTLIDPHEVTSTHSPYVAVEIDNAEVARIAFELSMVFDLFQTAVAIRRGAIESVICEACSLDITLSLTGWQPPLIHRMVQLPVRLPVHPPQTIPLPGRT
jgi:hypothetical protein